MTVKELKEKIATYPDDAEVVHWDEELPEGWAYMGEYSILYDEGFHQVRIQ